MTANAPGQLLGYSLQYSRALYHLLASGPGHAVCVEHIGDVATINPDHTITTEEDKSSIVGNPLTNRSVDLWKTFKNWIEAINSKTLDVTTTRFCLFTNQTGRHGIVNDFASVQCVTDAQKVVAHAKQCLANVDSRHEIWPHYDYVVNKNETLLLAILPRFELVVGEKAGYAELQKELHQMLVAESQIEFLIHSLIGWLLTTILGLISANQPAVIYWESFHHQFLTLFERCRCRELIDFTLQNPPQESSIKEVMKIRPCYLRQLEAIESSDNDLIEAVRDFMKAEVNREKWIESGVIDESIAADFEKKLVNYWLNQMKKTKITCQSLAHCQQGQMLLLECKSRQENIRDMSPPASTIAGTYHALADTPILGWHPEWERLFLKKEYNAPQI